VRLSPNTISCPMHKAKEEEDSPFSAHCAVSVLRKRASASSFFYDSHSLLTIRLPVRNASFLNTKTLPVLSPETCYKKGLKNYILSLRLSETFLRTSRFFYDLRDERLRFRSAHKREKSFAFEIK